MLARFYSRLALERERCEVMKPPRLPPASRLPPPRHPPSPARLTPYVAPRAAPPTELDHLTAFLRKKGPPFDTLSVMAINDLAQTMRLTRARGSGRTVYAAGSELHDVFVLLRSEAPDAFSTSAVELRDAEGKVVRSIAGGVELFGEEALQAPHTACFESSVRTTAAIANDCRSGEPVVWLGKVDADRLTSTKSSLHREVLPRRPAPACSHARARMRAPTLL